MCFINVRHLHPSLMFARRAGAYASGARYSVILLIWAESLASKC
jgi:hypothetical protein